MTLFLYLKDCACWPISGCSFKQLCSQHPLADLRSPEEKAAVIDADAAGLPKESSPVAGEDATLDADTIVSVQQEKSAASTDSEDLEKFMAIREGYYKKTKEEVAKIRDFEFAIKRPYFHVKPLDDSQLGNWHRYLDFIEKEGDCERVGTFCNFLLLLLSNPLALSGTSLGF